MREGFHRRPSRRIIPHLIDLLLRGADDVDHKEFHGVTATAFVYGGLELLDIIAWDWRVRVVYDKRRLVQEGFPDFVRERVGRFQRQRRAG